jgi:hypothetical protein
LPRLRDLALHHGAPDTHHLTPSSPPRATEAAQAARAAFRAQVALDVLTSRVVLAARVTLAALVVVAAILMPGAALAADPTPDPVAQTASPPTCSDRFPAEGPAGVDLRLGCIVSEVVGLYTAGQAEPPPPLSSYAIFVGLVVVGAVVTVWLVGRFVARRAGRRMAPVLAGEWWICGSCRSVNGAGVTRCYSCGSGRPDGPMLTTDEHPQISQSFGNRRKRG